MSARSFPKTALAALFSLGFAMGAAAQSPAGGGVGAPGSPAGAGSPSQPAPATRPAAADRGNAKEELARADRKFLEEAAAGGMAEVELGRLAQQKARSPEVKQFGERMVQDHGKANEELRQLAGIKGVDLPQRPARKHRSLIEKLEKASAEDFDREYMKAMVDDHEDDVSAFEKTAKSSKDGEIKSFASKTLPTLKEHLAMAQRTEDAVKSARR